MRGYKINSEANSENPMRAVRFFNLYFSKFHLILLSNLLFLPFNALAIGYAVLMYKLFGGVNVDGKLSGGDAEEAAADEAEVVSEVEEQEFDD